MYDIKILYLYVFEECDSAKEEACKIPITSNNCAKIKGVDTCLCGRGTECNPYGSKPKCVNAYGHSRPKDQSLKCKAGNYINIEMAYFFK